MKMITKLSFLLLLSFINFKSYAVISETNLQRVEEYVIQHDDAVLIVGSSNKEENIQERVLERFPHSVFLDQGSDDELAFPLGIKANFNNIEDLQQIAKKLAGMFHQIIIDDRTFKWISWDEESAKTFFSLLRQDGALVFDPIPYNDHPSPSDWLNPLYTRLHTVADNYQFNMSEEEMVEIATICTNAQNELIKMGEKYPSLFAIAKSESGTYSQFEREVKKFDAENRPLLCSYYFEWKSSEEDILERIVSNYFLGKTVNHFFIPQLKVKLEQFFEEVEIDPQGLLPIKSNHFDEGQRRTIITAKKKKITK